jgi:hypothetical protein
MLLRPIYVSLLILAIGASEGVADNKKLELTVSEYETNFKYVMPVGEEQKWKIDVGYHDEKFDESEKMTKREGKISTEIKKKNYFLSGSYNHHFHNGFSLSLGGDYEHFSTKMGEWGYYDETIRDSSKSLSFENNIEIEGERFSLSAGMGYKFPYFDADIMLRVTPKEKFTMRQDTQVFPVLTEGGELDSKATLDTSYKIDGEIFTSDMISQKFKIGVEGSYEKIPYTYQVKGIKDTNYNEFITRDIEYDEETTKYNLVLLIKQGERSYFDIKIGKIINKQIDADDTTTYKERTITAGVEIWF